MTTHEQSTQTALTHPSRRTLVSRSAAGLLLGLVTTAPAIASAAPFQLFNVMAGTCLNVDGGSSALDTNTQQFTCDATNGANLWQWVGTGDWQLLQNVEAGTCLNVDGGSSAPGTNTHQFVCDASNDANLWQWVGTGAARQLVNKGAGTCLNVDSGSSALGANTHQYVCDPTNDANNWTVELPFQLRNVEAGTCLNVEGGDSALGTNTQQFLCDTTNGANLWQWVGAGDWRLLQNIEAGTCLNVDGGSSALGTNTHQFVCDAGNDANLWQWVGTGTARRLVNKAAGTCLNVDGGSSALGANAHQFLCDASNDANNWTVELPVVESGAQQPPPPQATLSGQRVFRTSMLTGMPLTITVDADGVVDGANGASLSGTVTVGAGGATPGVVLGSAEIELTFDSNGYVSTLVGTAQVSLPSTGALGGLSTDNLGEVTLGLDWGKNFNDPTNPEYVQAPMQDDRQYLVYHVAAGLSGTCGAVQFAAGPSTDTLIVVDPRDPSVYFHGDLSGLTGMKALDDVGVGLSAQGLFPFQYASTWGIESFAQGFNGNLVLEGGTSLPNTPLTLDGQIMVRMPTAANPATQLGVNGTLSVGVSFVPGLSFTLPLGQASASAIVGQLPEQAYFSGVVGLDLGQVLPVGLPIAMSGVVKAAGGLSSNTSASFLQLAGQAEVGGFGLQNALVRFDANGVAVSGTALLPGFQVDVTGTAGPGGHASLQGTVTVSIPIRAPGSVVQTVNNLVYYTANGAVCGFTDVEDGAVCGYDSVSSGAVCGYDNVTSGAVCGYTTVASWFCRTFGCRAQAATCKVAKSCSVPKSCNVANSCSRLEPNTTSYIDPNFLYGTYEGTIQLGLSTDSGVSGSLSGSYCPVSGVCTPPAGARLVDLGGPDAKACVTIAGLAEICTPHL